jgi:NAD(P)-dependent dehydrogenase (short-subunit alcohol dehydrogenase family)
MVGRFGGKVVVITGGGGGIGRATAVHLAGEGAQIVLVDRAADALAASASAVERAGGTALAVEADVTRRADVDRYVAAARERFGGIDAFFNNAGILGPIAPLVDCPEDEFDRVIAVNLKGVWLGLRAVGALMMARGSGAIVNTASIAGLRSAANLVAYAASKHGVVGLTRTAAVEFARRGVRVNAICPAPIETAMADELEQRWGRGDPATFRKRMSATIPLGRYGKPEEVAPLVVFLLSDEASYLNGGLYTVDGGSMA